MNYTKRILVASALVFLFTASLCQTATVPSKDGVKIAYDVQGNGEPALIFVHGWSCDRSYWSAQIKPFSYRFKTVTLDLAGHGNSGMGRKDYTMKAFGDDVAAVVNKLGLKKVILIGHSMGGDVIAEAAKQLRGKVVALVFVDVYKEFRSRSREEIDKIVTPFRGDDFQEQVRALVKGMFVAGSNPTLVEQVANDMASSPKQVSLSAIEHALNYSGQMPRTLQELNLPVIAINPDNPPTDVNSMKLHNVQLYTMSGVGHFLMMENPEAFNKLLNRAIDKVVN
jgi:pimeloyl-ACP methyl ester carboxylesterase